MATLMTYDPLTMSRILSTTKLANKNEEYSPIEPAKPGCKPGSLEDTNPKTESGFNPKLMQIRCKPGGLEDKDPKTESGLGPKIMQKQSKPGSLKDQDPKSKISIIFFCIVDSRLL